MLPAGFTFELTVARLVKYKGVLAVRGRTPAHVRYFIYCLCRSKLTLFQRQKLAFINTLLFINLSKLTCIFRHFLLSLLVSCIRVYLLRKEIVIGQYFVDSLVLVYKLRLLMLGGANLAQRVINWF